MPIKADVLSFYVLKEGHDLELQDVDPDSVELSGYISDYDAPTKPSTEIVFVQRGKGESFAGTIPESLIGTARLLIVIPKIQLQSQRMSFSFDVTNPASTAIPAKNLE